MTQMSMFPVLFYLALQRNEFCLLLTVKNVFTLLFSLNWTFVPRCISGINHKVSSQLQVTLKMQQLSSWQADKAGITSPLCWRHQLPEKKWLWKSWRLFMKHREPKPTNILFDLGARRFYSASMLCHNPEVLSHMSFIVVRGFSFLLCGLLKCKFIFTGVLAIVSVSHYIPI